MFQSAPKLNAAAVTRWKLGANLFPVAPINQVTMNGAKPPKIVTDRLYPTDMPVVRVCVKNNSLRSVGNAPKYALKTAQKNACTTINVSKVGWTCLAFSHLRFLDTSLLRDEPKLCH